MKMQGRNPAIKLIVFSFAAAGLLFCLFTSPPSQSQAHAGQRKVLPERREYIFGVYPALPIASLDKLFSPLALEIGQRINRVVRFQSASSYGKYSGRLRRREFDIALVHPVDFVLYADKAGYLPLVRKNEKLSAIFVVPSDSPVKTLKELKGKTIAMPAEGSAVAFLAEAELEETGYQNNSDIVVKHFGGHDSTLQNVAIRNADAAVTCRSILRVYESSLGIRFRIIAETATIPHSMFVAHKRIPARERDQIKKVLLSTRFSGVPEDLRKAFVKDGEKPFASISREDLRGLRAHPVFHKEKR